MRSQLREEIINTRKIEPFGLVHGHYLLVNYPSTYNGIEVFLPFLQRGNTDSLCLVRVHLSHMARELN
jgi:hypothetical protein